MAGNDSPTTENLEQFRARMDCRSGVQMRISNFNTTQQEKTHNEQEIFDCRRSGVKNRISNWQNRETEYARKSRDNVFSDNFQPGLRVADSDYGTPETGSLTDRRGRLAGQRISNEVFELCQVISELGHQTSPSTWQIPFGHLFDAYTRISNKVVGMLMRARRQKLVDFAGEMLFQGRDNDVIITLLKDPQDIEDVDSVRQTVYRRK